MSIVNGDLPRVSTRGSIDLTSVFLRRIELLQLNGVLQQAPDKLATNAQPACRQAGQGFLIAIGTGIIKNSLKSFLIHFLICNFSLPCTPFETLS